MLLKGIFFGLRKKFVITWLQTLSPKFHELRVQVHETNFLRLQKFIVPSASRLINPSQATSTRFPTICVNRNFYHVHSVICVPIRLLITKQQQREYRDNEKAVTKWNSNHVRWLFRCSWWERYIVAFGKIILICLPDFFPPCTEIHCHHAKIQFIFLFVEPQEITAYQWALQKALESSGVTMKFISQRWKFM